MEACLVTNVWYLKKENAKCTILESKDDVSELICNLVHFFPFFLKRYVPLFSQNQL